MRPRDSIEWTRRLLEDAGVFAGISSGAAVAGAVKTATQMDHGTIVTLLPDGRHARPDTVACQAKLGGRPFGTGACHWKLPLSARGRRLVVQITVTYRGSQKTLPYSTTVR